MITPERLGYIRRRLGTLTESPYDGGIAWGFAMILLDELEAVALERDDLRESIAGRECVVGRARAK